MISLDYSHNTTGNSSYTAVLFKLNKIYYSINYLSTHIKGSMHLYYLYSMNNYNFISKNQIRLIGFYNQNISELL